VLLDAEGLEMEGDDLFAKMAPMNQGHLDSQLA
jgi:hypothetical protein